VHDLPAAQNARFWAGLNKSFIPGLKVVVGGPHVSLYSHHVVEPLESRRLRHQFEGEVPLVKSWWNNCRRAGDLAEVAALVYRDRDGKIVETERAKQVPDLDSLPYARLDGVRGTIDAMVMDYSPTMMRDGPWLSAAPTVHTLTSRGCPFLCKVLQQHRSFWKGKTRFRSARECRRGIEADQARVADGGEPDSFTTTRSRCAGSTSRGHLRIDAAGGI
jgi:hypothetical protein